jgi:hypothetical protein
MKTIEAERGRPRPLVCIEALSAIAGADARAPRWYWTSASSVARQID